MIFKRNLAKQIFICCSVFSIFTLYCMLHKMTNKYNNSHLDKYEFLVSFRSECDCHKDVVSVYRSYDGLLKIVVSNKEEYFIDTEILKNVTCDLYKVLRRGLRQNVVAYSLYGQNKRYYDEAKTVIEQISNYYPGWVMRIHHDESINKSLVCELECLNNDNVDFCFINKIPFGNLTNTGLNITQWNADYIHAMMWRWLSVGDSFVDNYMSRDLDSWIIQREVDAVKVWQDSNTVFHIIRDHPLQKVEMQGGMWNLKTGLDRSTASEIMDLFKDKSLAFIYKNNNHRDHDQTFLKHHIWPIAKKNATIHDSYNCETDLGGIPFPTRRPEFFCFVPCIYCCDPKYEYVKQGNWTYVCPEACRPVDHKDWIYC